nr:PREDICTED: venom serine carboxypeptidase-like [Bemisia tabaci]
MFGVVIFLLMVIHLSQLNSLMFSDMLDTSQNYITQLSAKDDCGKPLHLTPLIESGKISEAQNISRVTDLEHNIKSHAGFLTVNKRFKTNLFFWFFKAKSNDWENSPLLLWLQGGPGMTSLYGLFMENGPFEIKRESADDFSLLNRKYAWTNEYNVVYIDNPAGVGYSHTGSEKGYATNQKQVANNLYKALVQLFKLFPSIHSNKFFLTGESYAGKYIPALGYKIHSANKKSKFRINLTGLFVGNAFFSPGDQMIYGDYLKMIGLLDENQQHIFNTYQADVKKLIDKKDWLNATFKFSELFFRSIYGYPTLFNNYTGLSQHYNYISDSPAESGENYRNFMAFLTKASTRKMIHVGNTPWGEYNTVAWHLRADIMKSVSTWLEVLLDHYDVLFYNGQLDVICAYPGTVNAFKQLQWSGTQEYRQADSKKWYIENKLAGYYKKAGRFIDIMVRNTGHMVPRDNPLWAYTLLNQFVSKSL